MRLVASMDGTQCEEALMHMEGITTIAIHVLDYYFVYGLFRLLAFFSSLVEIVVLLSTRVFLIGNPYLILREGDVL